MNRSIDTLRTRRDGSIDTSFYMQRGRALRSRQAHMMTHSTSRAVARTAVAATFVFALILVLPAVF
ncbi:hypothetical protein HKCCE3408_18415 [Rhodobacterales bacterium HKCCE3408]|nr:hypothetical protein [Rhodobacterales bacterium HKCCE3408]